MFKCKKNCVYYINGYSYSSFLLYLNYKLYYPSFFGLICESLSIFNATKKIYTSNLSELPKKNYEK